ncbi:ETX/MTX2 family pore-forming toxin [Bacillus thuringiensis]|uniref:ETX/MTX2 family pore-forming toxin n=1 Tax=Bacillus thuringiensis TaxID=1428 RepID=UPI000EC30AF5|nr:ETX/MTX2 family pore-forming toxin [Bacillus thuringiensis]MDZ3952384.1 ETX/MTX2 family pore-forming toxin [Bacillus thuringiensis]RGP45210.1 hypothetical protein BTW32_25935 [Bacillus thuringiensis]
MAELDLAKILQPISLRGLHNLIGCDMELYQRWNFDTEFYPMPVSPKITPSCGMDMPYEGKDCSLQGLKLYGVGVEIDPLDLIANSVPWFISVGTFQNASDLTQTFQTTEFTEKITDTTTVTKTKTLKVGNTTSTKTTLDVFLIDAEVSTSITVEGTWSTAETQTHTVEKTLRVPPMSVIVPPRKGMRVKAEYFKGELNSKDIKINAQLSGKYKINNGYHWYDQDLYPILKSLQLGSPNIWKGIEGNGIKLNDATQTVTCYGLGTLNANFTTSTYNVLYEEFNLSTGRVEKVTKVAVYPWIISSFS